MVRPFSIFAKVNNSTGMFVCAPSPAEVSNNIGVSSHNHVSNTIRRHTEMNRKHAPNGYRRSSLEMHRCS